MMADFILESSMRADKNDMFYKPESAEEWQRLQTGNFVRVEKIESKSFEKKYSDFENDVLTLTAAASKGLAHNDISFAAAVNTAFNAVYYSIFSSKGKQQAEVFLSSPDPATAAKVMNMLDSKYTKPLLSLAMPSIEVNKRIYVPKLLPRLTTKNVMVTEDLSRMLSAAPRQEASEEDVLGFDPNVRLAAESPTGRLQNESTTYIIHKMKPMPDSYVKIRILSPDTLPTDRKPGKQSSIKGMNFDRILVDIHGGGFISTTTRCHQTYLRKWAKECNLVIFAIDYKLAPEVKYPAVLDDVWQAYFWIITQAEKQLGIPLSSITFFI